MKNKNTLTQAKDSVVYAAKNSLGGVKDVAGEALGAAAAAAAGVVIVRAAEAFLAGGEELRAVAPALSAAAKETAAAPFIGRPRTHPRPAARVKKANKSATAHKK